MHAFLSNLANRQTDRHGQRHSSSFVGGKQQLEGHSVEGIGHNLRTVKWRAGENANYRVRTRPVIGRDVTRM